MLPSLQPPPIQLPANPVCRRDRRRALVPAVFGKQQPFAGVHTLALLQPPPPVLPHVPPGLRPRTYTVGFHFFQSPKSLKTIAWFPHLPAAQRRRTPAQQPYPYPPQAAAYFQQAGTAMSIEWMFQAPTMQPQVPHTFVRAQRGHLRAPFFFSSKVPKLGPKTIVPED